MDELKVEKFTHLNEPYGTVVMTSCTWVPYVLYDGCPDYHRHCVEHGLGELTGLVVKGGETSRLFWATSTRDLAGTQWRVARVSKRDIEAGYKRTVAM